MGQNWRGVGLGDRRLKLSLWQTEHLHKQEVLRASERAEMMRNLKVREREIESMFQVCFLGDGR
jgi:hypothetical protein